MPEPLSPSMILIVEDEPKLARLLADYLAMVPYQTHCIDHGLQVVDWVRTHKPDLILLDIMLPGLDGMEICKQIRAFSSVPIIMLTARVEEIDRLLGLELGADDYICKPFSPREVVARVKAVLRRMSSALPTPEDALIRLDESRYKAYLDGRELALTAVEFQLLNILAAEPGRVYSRDQLMDRIYRDHRIVSDRTIDSHVKKLRKKMAELAPELDLIRSIYGVGYKLELP